MGHPLRAAVYACRGFDAVGEAVPIVKPVAEDPLERALQATSSKDAWSANLDLLDRLETVEADLVGLVARHPQGAGAFEFTEVDAHHQTHLATSTDPRAALDAQGVSRADRQKVIAKGSALSGTAEWAERFNAGRRLSADLVLRLFTANLRLVAWGANRVRPQNLPHEARWRAAALGLLHSIRRFEVSRGTRLSTYAGHWIRQRAHRAEANHGRALRLPVHALQTRTRMWRATLEIWVERGRRAKASELAERMDLSQDQVGHLWRHLETVRSLHWRTPAHREPLALRLSDERQLTPRHRATRQRLEVEIEALLASLAGRAGYKKGWTRTRRIMRGRLGIGQPAGRQTLEVLGVNEGITRERIRQLEAKAIDRLGASAAASLTGLLDSLQ